MRDGCSILLQCIIQRQRFRSVCGMGMVGRSPPTAHCPLFVCGSFFEFQAQHLKNLWQMTGMAEKRATGNHTNIQLQGTNGTSSVHSSLMLVSAVSLQSFVFQSETRTAACVEELNLKIYYSFFPLDEFQVLYSIQH